jgi:hypothetical protein
MGALEIVARLGEIAAVTQRQLVDLLGVGEPLNADVSAHARRRGDGEVVRGHASARRNQMMG